MARYEDYMKTDYLDTTTFIAGTDFTFRFPLYNDSNEYVNANAYSMTWLLSPYGQPEYKILQKSGVVSGSTLFIVTLDSDDTIDLGGQYLQQIVLTNIAGEKIRPAQGVVIIRKAIPES